jgi:hypothetical protein
MLSIIFLSLKRGTIEGTGQLFS